MRRKILLSLVGPFVGLHGLGLIGRRRNRGLEWLIGGILYLVGMVALLYVNAHGAYVVLLTSPLLWLWGSVNYGVLSGYQIVETVTGEQTGPWRRRAAYILNLVAPGSFLLGEGIRKGVTPRMLVGVTAMSSWFWFDVVEWLSFHTLIFAVWSVVYLALALEPFLRARTGKPVLPETHVDVESS